MKPDKINLASLGNMTPHLHWHVIPRFVDDKHFPAPIWATPTRESSAKFEMRDLAKQLKTSLHVRLS
jgi:diadenosine tetraphosphate (Ap4A) HIT family hydrolase